MMTWCMTHPWMTLIIVILLIIIIEEAIANICNVIINKNKSISINNAIKAGLINKEELLEIYNNKQNKLTK